MKIYKVYVASTGTEDYFKSKKGVKDFINGFYKQHKRLDPDYEESLEHFIEQEGIEISDIYVEE